MTATAMTNRPKASLLTQLDGVNIQMMSVTPRILAVVFATPSTLSKAFILEPTMPQTTLRLQ